MMIKVIPPGAQRFEEPVAQLIKVSSAGLRGEDLRTFIKRAGHEFADALQRVKLGSGEVPIHLLAIGATEFYGPNRNGDGFTEDTCKRHHPTFVKHARFYRNHVNKDPAKSYGLVKLSHYNDKMHRIELLAVLNANKEAAARNGGLVAEEELEKLARGDDIGVSMACKVPFDVCSVCGNRAKSRDEYCRGVEEGGKCSGGGLFSKIATVLEDGTQVYADNPDPCYFDISRVPRPADRIAWVTGRLKAASAVAGVGGAALAEMWGVSAPLELMLTATDGDTVKVASLLQKLASVEKMIEATGDHRLNLAFSPEVQPPYEWNAHQARLPAHALWALAHEKVAMPLHGFLQFRSSSPQLDATAATTRRNLPGIYTRLLASDSMEKLASAVRVYAAADWPAPLPVRSWASKCSADYSFDAEKVRRRMLRATIHREAPLDMQRPQTVKVAGSAEDVARAYALYKVAFLQAVATQDREFDLTCELAVRQNYL